MGVSRVANANELDGELAALEKMSRERELPQQIVAGYEDLTALAPPIARERVTVTRQPAADDAPPRIIAGAAARAERNAAIVAAVRAGEPRADVAARFGVSIWTVKEALKAARDHLEDAPSGRGRRADPAIATRNAVIVAALERGEKPADVAARIGVRVELVWKIRYRAARAGKITARTEATPLEGFETPSVALGDPDLDALVAGLDAQARASTEAFCGARNPRRPAEFCAIRGAHEGGPHSWQAASYSVSRG